MKCPKCGAEQPDADTCSQCQVVVEKYLKYLDRQQSAQRSAPPTPAVQAPSEMAPKSFPVGKVVTILALLVLAILGFGYKVYKASLKGTYDDISGEYTNKHYGFSILVPPSWKRYSVKEGIECKTINAEYSDDYFLLSSPTEPSNSMLVVSVSGINAEYFASQSWESFVSETSNRHQVVFNSIDTIDDFRMYRMGYMIGAAYREDNYFMANNGLILIYYYSASPESSRDILEAMKQAIQSLKRI